MTKIFPSQRGAAKATFRDLVAQRGNSNRELYMLGVRLRKEKMPEHEIEKTLREEVTFVHPESRNDRMAQISEIIANLRKTTQNVVGEVAVG